MLLLLSSFSRVWLCVTLWMIACQAPLSMEFSGQEYWTAWAPPHPAPPVSDHKPQTHSLHSSQWSFGNNLIMFSQWWSHCLRDKVQSPSLCLGVLYAPALPGQVHAASLHKRLPERNGLTFCSVWLIPNTGWDRHITKQIIIWNVNSVGLPWWLSG